MTIPPDLTPLGRPYPAAVPATTSRSKILAALSLDVAMVIVFAASGRVSHSEDVLSGLWNTAWPFLAALLVGWVVARAWLSPLAPMRTGIPVWAVTVPGVMLLRWTNDQGTQWTFILVAAGILFAFLVGWRVVGVLASRGRRQPKL